MKWYKIHRHSKITLQNHTVFATLGNTTALIRKGTYYITGFFANVCGLASTLEKAQQGVNEHVIISSALKLFYHNNIKIGE